MRQWDQALKTLVIWFKSLGSSLESFSNLVHLSFVIPTEPVPAEAGSRNPEKETKIFSIDWIPASAGMTKKQVTGFPLPAFAGTGSAGMTKRM